jgi:hypothetical protein
MPGISKLPLPISLNFDHSQQLGTVVFVEAVTPGNLHEYYLEPAYGEKDGKLIVVGYGLVHRSDLPTPEKIREFEAVEKYLLEQIGSEE